MFGSERRRLKRLAAVAQEGRELGFLDDALAILPPEIRRKVYEAERAEAARLEKKGKRR